MSAREQQERLLLAAARAYIQARLSNTPSPPDEARYARWLALQDDPAAWQGIEITLPLGDVLAAVKGLEEGENYRVRYETERKGLGSWITAWPKVIEAWRAKKSPSASGVKIKRANAVDYDAIEHRLDELMAAGMKKWPAIDQIAQEERKTFAAIRQRIKRTRG